ncbi:hypothetical protein HD806DRAFT_404431 [Xylariaceae sp. AK1471]|nr:hypothetical protein HD806DRAFT_404431 [Xylariaceae sp. AK1471]
MADQDMRLRLVVRRNGLPEIRLMWNVRLDSDPTIAKLLEQLNNDVPLESDQWGLEDYVVELHDTDGTDFECLHYQLVRSVLKPDDRVFIRALGRDDHRRRRISGRHQISSDGRHLIDGVPFGRPRLRAPTDRPTVRIPPRKRARLTYTQQDGDFDQGSRVDNEPSILLLTNGEPHKDGHTPSHTQVTAGSVWADSETDDADFTDDAELSSLSDKSLSSSSSSENTADDKIMEDNTIEGVEEEDTSGVSGEDLNQEALDLAIENAALEEANPHERQVTSLGDMDKLAALRAAFPTAPVDICEKVLAASKGNLKTTYNVLTEGFDPQMSREAVMAQNHKTNNRGADLQQYRALVNSASTYGIPSGPSTRKSKSRERSLSEDSDNDEDEKHDTDLLRKYDRAGFPPGTITSGKGLTHMATVSASFASSKMSGTSEATSATLMAAAEQPVEEDDSTSSSGSSSSSSASGDESDVASEDGASSKQSSSQHSSPNAGESDSESGDDSSQKPNGPAENDGHRLSSPTSESRTSDSGSDSGPEERPFRVVSRSSPADINSEQNDSSESLDGTSDSGSTTTDSSSDSEGADDEPYDNEALATNTFAPTRNVPHTRPLSTELAQTNTAPIPVPPGAGKDSTKRRNARRRAAKLAKREEQKYLAQDVSATGAEEIPTEDRHTIDNETALFEAKRKALLDAIATGGIEVGPSGETALDRRFIEADRVKRKRTEEADTSSQHHKDQADVETTNESLVEDHPSPSTSEKRRRVDLGVGRRLLFGALGLRNPKNKEDEDKLRDKLLSDARLHANRPLSSRCESTAEQPIGVDNDQDLDAWKLKINYRAVECCYDSIELSPAPFPFHQRWDSQQQISSSVKRNKRGGQSKRTQRNQPHYYNDDSRLGKKRKHHNSNERMHNGYDLTFDRGDDDTNDANVTLNYDDTESRHHDQDSEPVNETSQATDIDDLPSLPADVLMLPTLRPGQAQAGMVISWQKWSCSSATSWQPQLSRVTAIVVRVDDDSAALEVCLAKRDRYLDGNEKRYDHRTGQRIYEKFEAPDMYEEDDNDNAGVDEGYRIVSWAEMQDPRILQQPLDTTAELDANSNCVSSVQIDATSISIEPDAVAHPTRLISLEPEPTTNERNPIRDDIHKANASLEGRLGDSSVEPCVNATSNSTSHLAGQDQQATDMSMSDVSQISSPSRQLHETTSQAISSNSPTHNWAHTSSGERVESSPPNTSSSMPLSTTESSLPHLEEGFESDAIAGTPRVVQCPTVIPSSASSVRSGRQPDYAMDIDGRVLESFNAADDIDPQNFNHQHSSTPQARSSSTPVPSYRTATPDYSDKTGGNNTTRLSPIAPPSSRSQSSLNSLWCTALTSHSTQSPSRIQSSSANMSQAIRDLRYEEATRKLNDDNIEESSSQATNSFKVKEEEDARAGSSSSRGKLASFRDFSTQSQPRNLEAISPPPKRRSSKPFTIPPGTQIFELSSDSEPTYTENYADDDVDGTYSPKQDSLPRGDGWVKKKRRDVRQRKARS